MNVNKQNIINLIEDFKEKNKIDNSKLALIIGHKTSYIEKILLAPENADDEFLKQFAILSQYGIGKYEKLTKSEKEKISEKIGAITMTGISLGSIATIVSGLGISGLSGAGIMSGLATIGGIVGGGALVGISIIATTPILAGTIGYFGVRKINSVRKKKKNNN